MTILKKLAVALVSLTAVSLVSATANASENCANHDDAVAALAKKYSEKIVSRGLAKGGTKMVEVFASENGSWTIVVTNTAGVSCIFANGESWHDVPAAPALVSRKDT